MRRPVTLYEFMPYGAPELIESRQRHMSRALVLTSTLALALCALGGGALSLVTFAPVPPRRIAVEPEQYVIPLPPVHVTPPAARDPVAPAIHEAATPVPVRDDIAPPSEAPAASPGESPAESHDIGTSASSVPSEVGTGGPASETLPPLGTWVYVEHDPAPLRQVKPEYPQIARDAGVEGPVTVHVLVGTEGRVLDAVLADRIQVPMLNEAALTAARQWIFKPGLANGKPVACWTAIPFRFRLH